MKSNDNCQAMRPQVTVSSSGRGSECGHGLAPAVGAHALDFQHGTVDREAARPGQVGDRAPGRLGFGLSDTRAALADQYDQRTSVFMIGKAGEIGVLAFEAVNQSGFG